MDDEALIREIFSEHLSQLAFKTITAAQCAAALEIFSEQHDSIDLVITDILMPMMDGQETLEKTKQIDANAKVIIASGYIAEAKIEELLAKGASAFIEKPVKLSKLKEAVTKAFEA